MGKESRVTRGRAIWKILSFLGMVTLVLGFFGALTVSFCGNGPGDCLESYTNDYIADLVGVALIMAGLAFLLRKSSPEIQRATVSR
ncbi:MAG: hypothetical protein JRN52_12640 [Nitrososphaerota archaeon]|nr:hypothetical protein [Nitrososphaerota archaeon]